ncbi:hypothetical protein ACFRAQ_08370 [Nocardia sp. NPDC056611]|uniref:hypothetical protein n=1 Tax=Nocardia sp. NPDC056611 TaxID=3345877 RepID=UPI00366B9DDD
MVKTLIDAPVAPLLNMQIRGLGGALGPSVTGAKPYTFLAPGESAAAAFDTNALARLREIKRNRDPHNVIRANFPVLG